MTKDNLIESPRVRSFPDLLRKEVVAALFSMAALCFLAILIDAPTGAPADSSGLPAENVKAPWIFVGIQQILRYLPAVVAGVMLPLAAVLVMAFVPFVAAHRSRFKAGMFFGLVIVMLVLTVWGYFG